MQWADRGNAFELVKANTLASVEDKLSDDELIGQMV